MDGILSLQELCALLRQLQAELARRGRAQSTAFREARALEAQMSKSKVSWQDVANARALLRRNREIIRAALPKS